MSVIFLKKEFDQLQILFNNLLLILFSVLILLTAFNFINSSKAGNLNNDLELLQGEELKYKTLLKDSISDQRLKKIGSNKYQLLISLAAYADNIVYNSLYFKNNIINLKAVSSQQEYIFALIDALENDHKFTKADLININQKENYYFELEILTGQ